MVNNDLSKTSQVFSSDSAYISDVVLDADLEDLFGKGTWSIRKGPWLCLNAVCSNYHKPVVTDLTITRCYDTGNPVGTFRCDCGFVFHEEDLIKIKKIITALVQ